MALPKPITRTDYYLSKIEGEYQGSTPKPIQRKDFYLAKIAGDYTGMLPKPITRQDIYLAKIAGDYSQPLPKPITRIDYLLSAIAGSYDGNLPSPITREEMYLTAIANQSQYITNTAQGTSILLTDSIEAPLQGLKLFGKSTQFTTTGAQLFNVNDLLYPIVIDVNIDGNEITLTAKKDIDLIHIAYVRFNTNPGQTYIMSADIPEDGLANINEYDENMNLIRVIPLNTSFTASEGHLYEAKIYLTLKGQSVVAGTQKTYKNVMVNKGSTALPWEPYTGGMASPSPDYPQEIVSAGDSGQIEVGVYSGNLIDENNFNSQVREYETGERIELINNGNGSLTVTGTTPTNIYFVTVGYNIPLQDGEYTLTANGNFDGGVFVILRMFLKNNTSKDFEISKNTRYRNFLVNTKEINRVYIFTQVSPGYSVDCTFFPILNYGTNPIPWEPYTKQSLTYPTPNGLPGIPVSSGGNYTDESGQQWVCDEVDFGRGVYVNRVGILDNNISNLTISRIDKNLFYIDNISNFKNSSKLLCSIFIDGNTRIDNYTISALRGSNDRPYFRIEEVDTVEGLKDKFGEIEMKLYYELKTPIELTITPEILAAYAALHTNYPTTTVMNDAGAGMEVGYKAKPVSSYKLRRRV